MFRGFPMRGRPPRGGFRGGWAGFPGKFNTKTFIATRTYIWVLNPFFFGHLVSIRLTKLPIS